MTAPTTPAEILLAAGELTIEYLDEWRRATDGDCVSVYVSRTELVKRYSWAIPSPEALTAIADHAPRGVVEIGAGGGYWAMLLQQAGVPVVAYDPVPPPCESHWHDGHPWTEVLLGDHTSVLGHPDRALLLCWPNYDAPHAAQAIELYGGDTVIYIGEGSGGCTGDDRMHALLGEVECWCWDEPCHCAAKTTTALFREVAAVDIPQWSGIHDRLTVHKRVTSDAPNRTATEVAEAMRAAAGRAET